MASQAWALRRMISTYNAITRRPHLPRERALRQIMAEQGLGVEVDPPARSTNPGSDPSDNSSDDADHGDDSDLESDSTDSGSSRPGSDDEDSDVLVEDHGATSILQEISSSFSGWKIYDTHGCKIYYISNAYMLHHACIDRESISFVL